MSWLFDMLLKKDFDYWEQKYYSSSFEKNNQNLEKMIENANCCSHWVIIFQLAAPGSVIENMARKRIKVNMDDIPIDFWLAVINDNLLLSRLKKVLKKKIVARGFSYEEWLELIVLCSEFESEQEKEIKRLLEVFEPLKDR